MPKCAYDEVHNWYLILLLDLSRIALNDHTTAFGKKCRRRSDVNGDRMIGWICIKLQDIATQVYARNNIAYGDKELSDRY